MATPKENRRMLENAQRAARVDADLLADLAKTHRPDRLPAASAPIAERAASRHAQVTATLAAAVEEAHAEMLFSYPANTQRRAVLSDPNAPARAAALADLLRAAPIAELSGMAENAARTRDDVLSHALRGVAALRHDLTSEQVAPIMQTLNTWHGAAHERAIDDLIGAQFLAYRALEMGALADAFGLLLRDPLASLSAYRKACAYVGPDGIPVTVRDDKVQEALARVGVIDSVFVEDHGESRHAETLALLTFA